MGCHFLLQGQTWLLFQVSLDFLLLCSSPYDEKDILFFFLVLVLEGLVGLHGTIQLQLLSIGGWGMDLDYCDVEWFALEINPYHSVIFETAPKYCISASFVNSRVTPFFSKGFLPTVVEIMVI